MSTPNRVSPGVPTGGQFTASQHSEPDMDLPAPVESFDERIQRERIEAPWGWDNFSTALGEDAARELYDTHRGSLGAAMADQLSGQHRWPRRDDPWEGTSARDRIRAGMNTAAAQHGLVQSAPVPEVLDRHDVPDGSVMPVEHPAVQGGAVFDSVSVDDQVFHRRRDTVFPGEPYAIRLQANRPLTDDEARHVAGAMGYAYRATVAGEPLGMPQRDTPYSFVVSADTTKSARDDLGVALEAFEDMLPTMIDEGSSVRKTDRAGAGTKGTRLVEGMHDPDLAFEVYYDDVYDDRKTTGS